MNDLLELAAKGVFMTAGAAVLLYVLLGFAEPDERVMLPTFLVAGR